MTKILKWAGILLLAILALLAVVLTVNTLSFEKPKPAENQEPRLWEFPQMAERLSKAITIETVSQDEPTEIDTAEFIAFQDFLKSEYPLIHSELELTKINDLSLLYRWEAFKQPKKKGLLLAAHYDVVPAEDYTLEQWSHPPFAGEIADGYLYGRGALDNKQSVIGLMEAVERLLERGYVPNRDIYLALGHDEEIGGMMGARAIADHLKKEGVSLDFTLDEGLVVTRGIVPGVERDVALIGLSEKGFVSVKITVQAEGGHSAFPGKESAISLLSEAILRLQNNQMNPSLTPPVRAFFQKVGPEMGFVPRVIIANLWLFEGLFLNNLLGNPSTASIVRTTTAPTIVRAGSKENVIPGRAEATVNFRILPGQTIEDVMNHIESTIDDPRFTFEKTKLFSEPSPLSSAESDAYKQIKGSIGKVFPKAIIAPSLMNAVADARHYTEISNDVYRFAPMVLESEDLNRIHGIDERISLEGLEKIPSFYKNLLKSTSVRKVE